MGFEAEKRGETQKKREKSRGKLTDELKQKQQEMFISANVPSFDKNPFATKDSPQPQTSLFFIIIYLRCQYGTELDSCFVFAVNRQPRKKSDDGNCVSETI